MLLARSFLSFWIGSVLTAFLVGCAGGPVRQEQSPWHDGIPAYELYKTALMHYACNPGLRYLHEMRSGPIDVSVLDTVVPGDPRLRSDREDDSAVCPSCFVSGYRDTTLPLLRTAKTALLAIVFMPIDSVTIPNQYAVGLRVYRDEDQSEHYSQLIEYDNHPVELGVTIDRSGTVVDTFGWLRCRFDVQVGPNQIGTYMSARDHIVAKRAIQAEFGFSGDTMPIRVMSMLRDPAYTDMLCDVTGYEAWEDSVGAFYGGLDTAIIGEKFKGACSIVRDRILYALSSGAGHADGPLIKFSKIDAGTIPGYRFVEADIYGVRSIEATADDGWGIMWDWQELMILDRQNRVVFSIGAPPGCRHP